MSGAVAATAGLGAVGSGSGTPGDIVWSDIFAQSGGSTNLETLSGITGALSVSATNTGRSQLGYTLNGASFTYAGPFAWPNGQTLGWYVIGFGAGTITVDGPAGELASFTYTITNPTSGEFEP